MDSIKDLIKSAMNKDAAGFENAFDASVAPKLDAALGRAYDEMFGAREAEPEVEQELQPEESNENEEV